VERTVAIATAEPPRFAGISSRRRSADDRSLPALHAPQRSQCQMPDRSLPELFARGSERRPLIVPMILSISEQPAASN
jgi:hypothetical protein